MACRWHAAEALRGRWWCVPLAAMLVCKATSYFARPDVSFQGHMLVCKATCHRPRPLPASAPGPRRTPCPGVRPAQPGSQGGALLSVFGVLEIQGSHFGGPVEGPLLPRERATHSTVLSCYIIVTKRCKYSSCVPGAFDEYEAKCYSTVMSHSTVMLCYSDKWCGCALCVPGRI